MKAYPGNVKCNNFVLSSLDFDVRVRDGESELSGRVEVLVNDEWGTLCHQTSEKHVGVVCRQLGYYGPNPVVQPNAHFGQGTGLVHMQNLNCQEIHNHIMECT